MQLFKTSYQSVKMNTDCPKWLYGDPTNDHINAYGRAFFHLFDFVYYSIMIPSLLIDGRFLSLLILYSKKKQVYLYFSTKSFLNFVNFKFLNFKFKFLIVNS